MPLKINVKTILLYAAFAAATALINFALPGAPLSFGLFYAALMCGLNIITTPIIYAALSVTGLNAVYSALAAAEAFFIALIVFLYRRSGRKMQAEAVLYAVIALAPYVIFADWNGFGAATNINPYIVKSIAAAAAAIFSFICYKGIYALLFRLYRCRLREDETVCLAVMFFAAGTGFYSVAGEAVYICFAAGLIALCTRIARSPASVICALAAAVPHILGKFDLQPMTAYAVISAVSLLFCNAGRFASPVVCAALTGGYMYLNDMFVCPAPLIAALALLLFAACALPALPSDKRLKEFRRRLVCEDELEGTLTERNRKRTGDKLYKISELFREIERAFMALDEGIDEAGVRERMYVQLKDKCCAKCEKNKKCEKTYVYSGFRRLIDAGCVKGRVNLIDLPSEITSVCSYPSDVMAELNFILGEYRKFMAESENARSGRRLLADQAHGVAETLKSCAVDLSRTAGVFAESENALKKALAACGISCPEARIDDLSEEVSIVVCGKPNLDAICNSMKKILGRRYILKEKYAYDGNKVCLVFTSPPALDAAFGVAYAIKNGEKISGDTHSVIKINEREFLMALSDGMGSGVYARKVSEAAISLIEAFYRAEMPEDTVLKTINKLLSFNRDERFTCIDIAAVNLETGRADFVKIGSPAGFIMREGQIKVLESASLPLGILDNLKPTVCTEKLGSGDTLVFMSDGVTSSFPSSTELYEFLQGLKPINPQNLADKILAEALERTGHAPNDDMTVVCTRLFDNGQ